MLALSGSGIKWILQHRPMQCGSLLRYRPSRSPIVVCVSEGTVAVAYPAVLSAGSAVVEDDIHLAIATDVLRDDDIITRAPEQRLEVEIAAAGSGSEIGN